MFTRVLKCVCELASEQSLHGIGKDGGGNIIDSFQGMDSMEGSQITKCYLSLKVYVGGVIGICVSFIEIAFPAEALSLFGVCMFFVHLVVLSSFSLTRDAFASAEKSKSITKLTAYGNSGPSLIRWR